MDCFAGMDMDESLRQCPLRGLQEKKREYCGCQVFRDAEGDQEVRRGLKLLLIIIATSSCRRNCNLRKAYFNDHYVNGRTGTTILQQL